MKLGKYAIQNAGEAAIESAPAAPLAGKLRFNSASVLFIAAGAGVIFWAGLSSQFRDDEKTLDSRFCLPLAAGFALVVLGTFFTSRWKTFAGWTALMIVGQAVSLQMINAGRVATFQQYHSIRELWSDGGSLLILFAAQTICVVCGLNGRAVAVKKWFGETFTRRQLILSGVFLFFAGAALTPAINVYLTSLSMSAIVQLVSLANVMLAVWSVPTDALRRLSGKIEALLGDTADDGQSVRLDRFVWLAALWVFVFAAALNYFVYERHPHVADEAQYLYQANYMAAGQLTVKPPLVPEAFNVYMTPYRDERWYGIFPPGYPAILAIGVKLGIPWLINPLLAGSCVVLTYLFFQELYSRRFARIGVLLLCCSPWFIFLAMSFMSHIFTLACALAAAVLLRRAAASGIAIETFVAGLLIGVVSLIRPLDGAIVAVLLGFSTLFGRRAWRRKLLTIGILTVGTMIAAALIFPYNKVITGSATHLPLNAYYNKYFWAKSNDMGFGPERGFDWSEDAFPGHSPFEAVINAAMNTFSINTELFGWAIGSLILVAFLLTSGTLRKQDFWAVAAIAAVIFFYSFYWFGGGTDFGARYWFLCIIPLVALTTRSIEWLGEKLKESHNCPSQPDARVILAVAVLSVSTLICYFPWRATAKYHHYLLMQPGIRELAEQYKFGKSLVLIRGTYEQADYRSAWVYNPLNFEGDAPLYAWDLNPEVRVKLLKAYADRPVWIVDGPTFTGSGYRLAQGPVAAGELLKTEAR